MSLSDIESLLGWSAIINMSILIYWFLMLIFAKDWIYQQQQKYFNIKKGGFILANYWLMGLYKILIIFFNIVPYLILIFIK